MIIFETILIFLVILVIVIVILHIRRMHNFSKLITNKLDDDINKVYNNLKNEFKDTNQIDRDMIVVLLEKVKKLDVKVDKLQDVSMYTYQNSQTP